MKNIIIGSAVLISASTFASSDNCKSKALEVAKAVDKVYVPKPAKNTRISVSYDGQTVHSYHWDVNMMVPNAGGQTAYFIEMEKGTCEVKNLSMLSE